MKLRNILIIFLFALFLTIIIYKINSNEKKKKILILGDNYLLELSDLNYIKLLDKNYIVNNNFTDNNKNYIGIYDDIVDNRCIYNKGKKECIKKAQKIRAFDRALKCKADDNIFENLLIASEAYN